MSCIPVIVTGDDVSIAVTLKKGGVTFNIPVTATITAALVSIDKREQYITDTSVIDTTSGSDWSNSLIIVEFSSTQTNVLNSGSALIEVQVNDSGKLTWFGNIKITGDTIA